MFVFLAFVLDFLCSFTEITVTVCARAQAAILQSSGHSVKEICQIVALEHGKFLKLLLMSSSMNLGPYS